MAFESSFPSVEDVEKSVDGGKSPKRTKKNEESARKDRATRPQSFGEGVAAHINGGMEHTAVAGKSKGLEEEQEDARDDEEQGQEQGGEQDGEQDEKEDDEKEAEEERTTPASGKSTWFTSSE